MATRKLNFCASGMARWAVGSTQLMLVIYGLYLAHLINFAVFEPVIMLGITLNGFIYFLLLSQMKQTSKGDP